MSNDKNNDKTSFQAYIENSVFTVNAQKDQEV